MNSDTEFEDEGSQAFYQDEDFFGLHPVDMSLRVVQTWFMENMNLAITEEQADSLLSAAAPYIILVDTMNRANNIIVDIATEHGFTLDESEGDGSQN